MVNIAGITKWNVLKALYDNAKPLGMGFLQYEASDMTKEQAQALLKEQEYFDYVKGRVMKVRIDKDTIDPFEYDRDNGQGSVAKVISRLRKVRKELEG